VGDDGDDGDGAAGADPPHLVVRFARLTP